MYTKDLIVNDNAQGKKVEHVCEIMPDIGVPVLAGAFCIKAVRLCYASRLVVASYQMYSVRESKL